MGDVEREADNLRKQLDLERGARDHMEQDLEEISAALHETMHRLDASTAEADTQKEQLAALQAQLTDSKEKLQAAQQAHHRASTDLERQLAHKDHRLAQRESEVNDLYAKTHEQERDLLEATHKLADFGELEKRLSRAEAERDEAKRSLADARSEVRRTSAELEVARPEAARKAQLEEEIAVLQKQLLQRQSDLEGAKEQLLEVQAIADANSDAAKKAAELPVLTRELEAANSDVNTKDRQIAALTATNGNLQR